MDTTYKNQLELLSHKNLFSEINKKDTEALHQDYINAAPYPHIILDNLFPEGPLLNEVLDEFPQPKNFSRKFDNAKEIKYATRNETEIPLLTRHFLYTLNSQSFLDFVGKITGIENLVADPYFEGGGLHQIMPGGKLSIHADFNIHSKFKLDRRLNILIYLNKDWQDEYGGHFEMWDQEMKAC